jgi:hypothetical protein
MTNPVAPWFIMISQNCLVWNVRGLNGRDRRNVVRNLIAHERASLVWAVTVAEVGSGESTFFWTDKWLQGTSIQSLASALFQAVSARRRKALVCDPLPGNAWVRHINGAHTVQVLTEYLMLWQRLQHVQLVPGAPDIFRWRFSADGSYCLCRN